MSINVPSADASPRIFNRVTGVCSNFYTSLDFKFLLAQVRI